MRSAAKILSTAILGGLFGGLPGLMSPALAQCVTSGADVTCTNSGTLGSDLSANAPVGTATTVNSGSIGSNLIVEALSNSGNANLTNSGSIGGGSFVGVLTATGNASLMNSGSIGGGGSIVDAHSDTGNASLTNSGSIGSGSHVGASSGVGSASLTNSGSIGGGSIVSAHSNDGHASTVNSGSIGNNSLVEASGFNGNVSLTNLGSIGRGSTVAVSTINGDASLTNAGFIGGNVAVTSISGAAALTNIVGSRIVGAIALNGNDKSLTFVGGGNYLYTLNSLAGVSINTNGAPFAVSGNTVAVLDTTALALEDRSVMNFTGGVSSMLQDRFGGMGIPGGAGGMAPLSFAAEPAGRINSAHDAFAGMPSLSMSYVSEGGAANARAMYTKAPVAAAPAYDTTVWASGFGGVRRQSASELVQAARDTAYGGAIGVDRQFAPDLRLGLFAGGGSSKLRTAFDVQGVDSEYGFGGGYGKWDRRDYYVDFALFAGGISSKSTRLIANNLAANGLDTATASYNGWFISPDVTWGYRLFSALGVVTPKARVRYVGGTLDSYTETGSAQGLVVGSRTIGDIEERLGVEFSNVTAFGGGTVRTSLDLSAIGLQRLGDNTINTVLLAQNLAFTTPGRREAYGGVVNAGFDWRPKSNVSFFASAEAMATNDKAYSVIGKGGVRVGF